MANAALLLIVGEPLTPSHKDLILAEITKGFRGWDETASGVDINAELVRISDRASPGQDGPGVAGKSKGGEVVIHHTSPSILVEILINPQTQTVKKSLKNFLMTTVTYRHLIYAGHSFQGSGAWLLQDDTFQFTRFAQIFKDSEVQQVLKQDHSALNVHCAAEGEWKNGAVQKLDLSKLLQISMNPEDKLSDVTGAVRFSTYISKFLDAKHVTSLLPASEIVGNIRFNKPTIYIFPGCEGDSCLFGISGFNLLVNGGYNRRACFWDFTCHLDRIDAVLLTHLGSDNIFGISSALERKSLENVYPDIGHIFLNASTKAKHSPEGEELSVDLMKKSHLLVNLSEEGNCILEYSRQLGHVPNACTRSPLSTTLDPVNLYHKVGHGSLDMYILTPIKDTKEMKTFYDNWNKLSSNFGFHNGFPNENLLSVSTLVVWRPDNPTENITRILFPGNTPQSRIFEGLEKLKGVDYLKHHVCCSRLLSKQKEVPAAPTRPSTIKTTTTHTTTKVVEKSKPPTSLTTKTVKKSTVGVSKPPVNDVRKKTTLESKPTTNDKARPTSPEKAIAKTTTAAKKPRSPEKMRSPKEKSGMDTSKAKPVKSETSVTKTKGNKSPEHKPIGRKSPGHKSPEQKSPVGKSPERKSPERKLPERKIPEQKSPECKSPEHLPSPKSPEQHINPANEFHMHEIAEANHIQITSETLVEADSEPQPLPEPVAIPSEPLCPYNGGFPNGLEHEHHEEYEKAVSSIHEQPEHAPEHDLFDSNQSDEPVPQDINGVTNGIDTTGDFVLYHTHDHEPVPQYTEDKPDVADAVHDMNDTLPYDEHETVTEYTEDKPDVADAIHDMNDALPYDERETVTEYTEDKPDVADAIHDMNDTLSYDDHEPVPEYTEDKPVVANGIHDMTDTLAYDEHETVTEYTQDKPGVENGIPDMGDSLPCDAEVEALGSVSSMLEHDKMENSSFREDEQDEVCHSPLHDNDDQCDEYENAYTTRVQSNQETSPTIEVLHSDNITQDYHEHVTESREYEDDYDHEQLIADEVPQTDEIQRYDSHFEQSDHTFQNEQKFEEIERHHMEQSFHEEGAIYHESNQDNEYQLTGRSEHEQNDFEQVEGDDFTSQPEYRGDEVHAEIADQYEHETPLAHKYEVEDSDEDNVGYSQSENDGLGSEQIQNYIECENTDDFHQSEPEDKLIDFHEDDQELHLHASHPDSKVQNTEDFEMPHTDDDNEQDDIQRDSLERDTEIDYGQYGDQISHREFADLEVEQPNVEKSIADQDLFMSNMDNSLPEEQLNDDVNREMHEISHHFPPELNLYEEETGSTLPAAFEKDITPDPTVPMSQYEEKELCEEPCDRELHDHGVCAERSVHEADDNIEIETNVDDYNDQGTASVVDGNPHPYLQPGLDGVNPFSAIDQQAIEQSHGHHEIVEAGSDEECSFDPIKEWGEPMALPQPMQTSPTAGGDASRTPASAMTETKRPTKSFFDRLATNKNRPMSARIERTTTTKSTLTRRPLSTTKSPSSVTNSRTKASLLSPIYVDLTYIPAHGDPAYSDVTFFKNVRARYYVLSTLSPNPQILSALLDAKKTWENKELEVSVIPTYESENLRNWMALNADELNEFKIDVVPAASRCTIQLQDHDTNCLAYRLEF